MKVNYLYRDSGNWKEYGSFVAENPENFTPEKYEESLRQKCIDREFFYHDEWNVPALFPQTYDPVVDPTWHELAGVEEIK